MSSLTNVDQFLDLNLDGTKTFTMHAEEFTTGETVFFLCTYGFCYFEAIWCRMTDGNEQQSSGNVQKPHNSLGSPEFCMELEPKLV